MAFATAPLPSIHIPVSPYAVPRFAGFWVRAVAAVMDFFIQLLVLIPVRMLLGSLVTLVGMNGQFSMHEIFMARRIVRIALGVLIIWGYRATMESSHFQATLGKLVMRLKVTDLDGNRISFARASGRYAARWLSFISLGLGYLMVGFDEEKQGLHDRIAGTRVLYR